MLRNTAFTVTTAADGTFALRSIPPGIFRLNIVSGISAGGCVASVVQGDRNVLKDGLRVQSDDVEVNVMLGESQATVKGNALGSNGARMPGAAIVLVPADRSRADLFFVIAADQNGEFEMSCIQPGSYSIYGWTELDGATYRNADFIRKHGAGGRTVEIAQGTTITVSVDVIPIERN